MVLMIIFIASIYSIIIIGLIYGFNKVEDFNYKDISETTSFTIIIPFRNEAENLPELLLSISQLSYSNWLFEIIFIDDNSNDNSLKIITNYFKDKNYNIRVYNNDRKTKSPKKDAISTAIKHAQHPWIITTDADCVLPKLWLKTFDQFIKKHHPKCIVAPVTYNVKNTFLDRFQWLDFMSLQGATIGGFGINKPFLCNGANFAYLKDAFEQVNGFTGNTNIASGDDIFLLEKMVNIFPYNVMCLKNSNAVVKTKTMQSINALFNQRRRWAAKTKAYTNKFSKIIGFSVLLMNALFITCLIFAGIGFIPLYYFIVLIVIKFGLDGLLIYKSANFFNQKKYLHSYLTGFIIYPFFSIVVAFSSFFLGYKWKLREFKQ